MTVARGVSQPSAATVMGEGVGVASHPKLIEGEVRVIGRRWSPRVHAIKAFLARSRVPYRWLDEERDGAGLPGAEATVRFPDGTALIDPDVRGVARQLGLETEPDSRSYDLIVVGGGPAGLAASIYGASEGMRTVVVEQDVPGGQASYSAIIENYPGFPDLVTLDDGAELSSPAVLLATGVSFRWLDAPGCASLVGAGIYYGAATAEATACRGQDICILGGGNSGRSSCSAAIAIRPPGGAPDGGRFAQQDNVQVSDRPYQHLPQRRGAHQQHRRRRAPRVALHRGPQDW